MDSTSNIFFRHMMEMISIAEESNFSKTDFLKETCDYFGISHSFIYEIDNAGQYIKKESITAFSTVKLDDKIDLVNYLGYELLSELSSEKIIIITGDSAQSVLTVKLKELFACNTLIVIPILNQNYELSGFVGLADRRSSVRNSEIDIKTSSAVLSLLANHVKLEMFTKGIANTERVLSNVLDNIGIDIYVNDYYTHDILYVNQSMAKPYGGVDNMIGKKCWQSIFTDKDGECDFCPQPRLLDEENNPKKTYTWDYQRMMDGSWFRVLSSSFPWTDGRIAHLVASVDITESKRNQLLIEKLAQYDYLTGLPNRRSLQDDVEAFTRDSELFSARWYVLFCDLDGFKKVNDNLGHQAGDVLLQNISNRLKVFSNDVFRAYRHGGDEFVMLIKDTGNIIDLEKLLGDIFNVFCDSYSFEGNEMKCGCSIGVSHFPEDSSTPKDLFFLADSAMYAAKKAGKGVARFCFGDSFITLEQLIEEKEF